jgi:hypothetical protein
MPQSIQARLACRLVGYPGIASPHSEIKWCAAPLARINVAFTLGNTVFLEVDAFRQIRCSVKVGERNLPYH